MKKYISPVTEQTVLHTENHLMLNISDSEGGTELTRQEELTDNWKNGWDSENWTTDTDE